MSEGESQKTTIPWFQSKTFAIFITILILLIASFTLFWYYQSIYTYALLQGFWHLGGNVYVLIDDNLLRVIEISNDGEYTILFEDSDVRLDYISILPVLTHTYRLTMSLSNTIKNYKISNNPFNSTEITLNIFPASGVIQITKDDGGEYRMTKDNAMSVEYLSSSHA